MVGHVGSAIESLLQLRKLRADNFKPITVRLNLAERMREIHRSQRGARQSGGGPLVRQARSIKGRVKRKNNPGDWKERCCSPRSPAQVMLRGYGAFAMR